MNSIQLISKIKSKSDDLQLAAQDLHGELHAIQKELLKKNCIELFELILKLKTVEELVDEKQIEQKTEIPFETTVQIKPVVDVQLELKTVTPITVESKNEVNLIADEPLVVATPEPLEDKIVEPIAENNPIQHSFNEFIKQINLEKATLNDLEKSTEIIIESLPIETPTTPVVEEKISTPIAPVQNNQYVITPPEFNIDKAVENKRIQKTVMPDPEPSKKISFNESIANSDPNFNDRFAERVNTQANPIIEKSIDSPIENMKTEIGLNKKIAFVNQLFAENVVEYAKAIDKLNQAINLEEGLKIFSELENQFKWNIATNPLVAELKQLLQRRHQA